MEEKKGNGKTILIATLVIIIIGLIGFIVYDKCFNKEQPPVKPEEQKEEKKEEEKKEETKEISYEVKGSNLYVNNKQVNLGDFEESGSYAEENIYNLGDLLLVGDCRSTCDWYFVDSEAKIVGSLGEPGQLLDEKLNYPVLVKTKFDDIHVTEVKDKTIYFYSHGYTTQDGSSICKYGENEAVYAEEKVTYNGNKQFGTPEVVSTKTRAQVIKEDARFGC